MTILPPEHLGPDGRRVWEDTAARIGSALESAVEYAALEAFCGQCDRLADARSRIALEGMVIEDARGNQVPHPALALERAAATQIAALAKRWRPYPTAPARGRGRGGRR